MLPIHQVAIVWVISWEVSLVFSLVDLVLVVQDLVDPVDLVDLVDLVRVVDCFSFSWQRQQLRVVEEAPLLLLFSWRYFCSALVFSSLRNQVVVVVAQHFSWVEHRVAVWWVLVAARKKWRWQNSVGSSKEVEVWVWMPLWVVGVAVHLVLMLLFVSTNVLLPPTVGVVSFVPTPVVVVVVH